MFFKSGVCVGGRCACGPRKWRKTLGKGVAVLLRRGFTTGCTFIVFLASAGAIDTKLSSSAYRALGQPDLRQNGVNRVQGWELHSPFGIALDGRDGTVHLYVADTANNRILAWQDVRAYQIGDAPGLVLGQPSPQHSAPLGIGTKGLAAPAGLAVDPLTGNLYVADYGNNRVLRFRNPFRNLAWVEPDAVYGQPDFATRAANSRGIIGSSMNSPRTVAFDSAGNLWVADAGNSRILRFNAATLDSANPEADLVIGQKDFNSGSANRGTKTLSASGLDAPAGLAFDQQNNLYVSDFGNARVLKFAAPIGPDAAAVAVYGQADFGSRVIPLQATSSSLPAPNGLTVDNSGKLYVAVPSDNRVLAFPASSGTGAAATEVLGQQTFKGTSANAGAFPQASATSLSGVIDVKVDPDGNVIVADMGNNRVLAFPRNSRSASQVWGQNDFSHNGANQIKPGSINAPFKIAIDYSQFPYALYVSDANNHRVLVWKDAVHFRTGDPADMAIGQPDLQTALPNVDSAGGKFPSRTSLSSPKGIAVDAAGNLYVADSDNNRVLRYPRPVNQSGRITPDAVIGQLDFTSSVSAAVSASSLKAPAGVAIGPDSDLFVADSGNNRVIEFPAGASSGTAAIRVYGQPNFTSSAPATTPSAQTLAYPQGVAVDASFSLYAADTGANRVVVYPATRDAPPAGLAASLVLGQPGFDSAAPGTGAAGLQNPMDLALDSAGILYVSDNGNNRVVSYPWIIFLPFSGATATGVFGQRDLGGNKANWNSADGLATGEGLYGPLGIFLDRMDTLYVGDAGNNRVLHVLGPATAANAAHNQASVPVSPGALVTLSSASLADREESAPDLPLPNTLASREVVINDEVRAPLSFLGPERADLQVPSAAPLGAVRIAVRTAETNELIAGGNINITAYSPGLFSVGQDRKGSLAVRNQDGTDNSSSKPALRGSVLTLFGTGQGPVSPSVPDGMAAPSDAQAQTVAVPTSDGTTCLSRQPSVCVAIGTTFGEIQFSGLAAGRVGVWQLNVKIPATAATGDAVSVRAVINGVPSNTVSAAIR